MTIDINKYRLLKNWKQLYSYIRDNHIFSSEDLKDILLIGENLHLALYIGNLEQYKTLNFMYLYITIPCLFREIFRELIVQYLTTKHSNPDLRNILDNNPRWLHRSINIELKLVDGILKTNNIQIRATDWKDSLKFYQDKDSNSNKVHRHLVAHDPICFQNRVSTETRESHIRHINNLMNILVEIKDSIIKLQSSS